MASVEVDSRDIIRLILQFLKENNLTQSLQALQGETSVSLNTVDSIENFVSDVQTGRWETVLAQISTMQLPMEKLINIYEQIAFELIEQRETELCVEFLRTTDPIQQMKKENAERYMRLEYLCQKSSFNASDVYDVGSSKEKRRQEIAESLLQEVTVVHPSRLLAIVGQALKFQEAQGLLPKGQPYDLFKGGKRSAPNELEEKLPKKQAGQIKFEVASHPEAIAFSPDGQSLVTGSIDGFIEVWDTYSCRLRKDLEYQANEQMMMHEDDPVLCCAFSKDGEYLASGGKNGTVKVWQISTGQCVRTLLKAHSQGITSIMFAKDGLQLLTTSFDGSARIHGLKSGKTLKEFRGHSSFVNCALFSKDGNYVYTGSSDGCLKVWDIRTSECLSTFRPGQATGLAGKDISVHTVQTMPNNSDHLLVVAKCPVVFIVTSMGQLLRTFTTGKSCNMLCATVSPKGKWIYCVGDDGFLYMFDTLTGQLENTLQITQGGSEVINLSHHPHRNLLCSATDDGQLKLWKP